MVDMINQMSDEDISSSTTKIEIKNDEGTSQLLNDRLKKYELNQSIPSNITEEADRQELSNLEAEKAKLKNQKTQSARNRESQIDERIKQITDKYPIETEVVTEEVVEGTPTTEIVETTVEERLANRDKELFSEIQEAPGIPGKPKISDITTQDEVSTAVYSNPKGNVDVVISSTGTDQNFVGFYRVYEGGKPTNQFTSKMQVVDGKGFGTMISEAQGKLPEGHQWMETKSVSKDGLRVWNKAKEKGYTEVVDNQGNVVTKEVTLNQATKRGS
jgi:hypothetical protein